MTYVPGALVDASGNALIGQQAMAGSVPVAVASNQTPIPVKVDQTTPGTTNLVQAADLSTDIVLTPTVSTSPAYTAGDLVGGKLTLSSALRASGATAWLQSIVVADKGKQNAALDIFFFNADPSGTTFTDNGAFTLADADLLKCIGHFVIAATDYSSLADNSVATKTGLAHKIRGVGSTSLYCCVVARGTPTYASTSDLQITVGILW